MSQSGLIDIEQSLPQIPTRFDLDESFAIPVGNVIEIFGSAVDNQTRAKPLFTVGSGNTVTAEIQVGAALTGAPSDKTRAGIVSFDDTQFTVTQHGYVQLAGGGLAIDQIAVDNATAPGTDPVLPASSGQITISGAAVDAHSQPVDIHSRAANALNVEVQVGSAVSSTPSDKTSAGLISANNRQFQINSDGYMQLVGGTDLPVVQTLTGDSGGAIGPDGSGNITLAGGTNISTTGSGNTQTINATGNASFSWVEETTTSRSLNTNEGVVYNNASQGTLTLPASASLGDKFCFLQKGAGTVKVAQNAGQTIHSVTTDTTTGTGGFVESIDQWTSFCIVCTTDNTDFTLERAPEGNLSFT